MQAGDVILSAEGIGVGAAFLNGVNQAVDADAIVEQSYAATDYHAPVVMGCQAKPMRGAKLFSGTPFWLGRYRQIP